MHKYSRSFLNRRFGYDAALSSTLEFIQFNHSFIGMYRMRRFLAVLSSFFHSSLLCTLSLHPVPPTSLPSFLTSSCHLFLGLPLSFFDSKFILKIFLRILFSSILCRCPNTHNLFILILSAIICFLTIAYTSLLVNVLQLPISLIICWDYSPVLMHILCVLKSLVNFSLSLYEGV